MQFKQKLDPASMKSHEIFEILLDKEDSKDSNGENRQPSEDEQPTTAKPLDEGTPSSTSPESTKKEDDKNNVKGFQSGVSSSTDDNAVFTAETLTSESVHGLAKQQEEEGKSAPENATVSSTNEKGDSAPTDASSDSKGDSFAGIDGSSENSSPGDAISNTDGGNTNSDSNSVDSSDKANNGDSNTYTNGADDSTNSAGDSQSPTDQADSSYAEPSEGTTGDDLNALNGDDSSDENGKLA